MKGPFCFIVSFACVFYILTVIVIAYIIKYIVIIFVRV